MACSALTGGDGDDGGADAGNAAGVDISGGGTSGGGTSGGGTSGGGATDASTAGDTAAGSDAAGAGDAGAADTGPKGCSPACKAWQICEAGACKNKACKAASECNDGAGPDDPEHWCVKGTCRAWQCEDDADCGAGNKCNTKTFRCYEAQTGCAYDAQCVDDKTCTDDTCDKETGKCKHTPVKGCCESKKDCDDGVACTQDDCVKAKCSYTAKPGCCTSDAECADSSPCTTDTCKDGSCHFKPKPDCCTGSGGCDDGLGATKDSCVANQCVHALEGMTTSCKADGDCKGTACVKGACVGGACSWTAIPGSGCCTTDAACATDKSCTVDACVGLVCQSKPASGSGTHVWARFDGPGVAPWTVTKGNSAASFHISDLLVFAGKGALRYGLPGKKSWSGGFPNKGSALSPAFTVPKGAKLRFRVFFDGEPSAGVHQFGARVVVAGKGTDVWTKNADLKGNTAGKWVEAVADLGAYAGKSAQVELWFDVAVKFPKEEGYGLIVDELRVEGSCP